MRQNYDVEIQAMFMELNRVKEDMQLVKNKTGIQSSNISGPKMVLGGNSGIGGASVLQVKRDERRYGEIQGNSSAGSSFGGFIENIPSNIYRGLEQRGFIMSGSQSRNNN